MRVRNNLNNLEIATRIGSASLFYVFLCIHMRDPWRKKLGLTEKREKGAKHSKPCATAIFVEEMTVVKYFLHAALSRIADAS